MRISSSLRAQLRLLGLLPAALLLLLLLVFMTWQRLEDAGQELQMKGQFISRHLATAAEYGVLSGNMEDLRQLAVLALEDSDVVRVEFRDLDTVMLEETREGLRETDLPNYRRHDFHAVIYRHAVPMRADASREFSRPVRPQRIGKVTVGLSDTTLIARQREVLIASLGSACLALVVALWIAGTLAKKLSSPLLRLSEQVRIISRGNYEARSNVPMRGELAALQQDINELAAELQQASRNQQMAMTELRDARQRAEEASQSKSDFLSMMSHELRTPMNGVLGMLQLLQSTRLNEEQKEYVVAAVQSTSHLLEVINDILDFSRIESGRLDIESVWFSLGSLLEDCVMNFRYLAEQKGLYLRIYGMDAVDDWQVRTDPTRLRQILSNLLSNAVKFTAQGGIDVQVTMERSESSRALLLIEVADTGIGIPQDRQAELFDAFSQLDSTTSRQFGGAGLGLSISKRLCELLGGQLSVASSAGQGTTFTLEMTMEWRPDRTHDPSADDPDLPSLQGTVLLVEDNEVNRLVAQRMLQSSGLTVLCATNGIEALRVLQDSHVDCVLMDIQMPEMDGLEAVRQIRQRESVQGGEPVPVIALTANALPGERERCLDAGMDDYMAKPYQRRKLLYLVARHLDAASSV